MTLREDLLTALTVGGAVFCVLSGAMLVLTEESGTTTRLLTDRDRAALVATLHAIPRNEDVKQEVRELDRELRVSLFSGLARSAQSSRLMLAGFVVFIVAVRFKAAASRRPPDPTRWGRPPDAAADGRRRNVARALGVVFAVLVMGGILLGQRQVVLAEPGLALSPPAPYASAAELAAVWPRFRGPGGQGNSIGPPPPRPWSHETGAYIRWKTAIPRTGTSSPILWDGAVYVTGADESAQELYCFDADSGALRWACRVHPRAGTATDPAEVTAETGFAAPTPATDGRRVYALFASGDVGGISLEGELLWARNLGLPDNAYGHATSLVTYHDRLLVQVDEGHRADGFSRLLALNGKTGETIWEVERDVDASWTTPLVAAIGGREQLITAAEPWLIAYDPATGSVIWQAECLDGELASSVVIAGDQVIAVNPYANVLAVDATGTGDVTETGVRWTFDCDAPDISSPAIAGDNLYLLSTFGDLTCVALTDGTERWQRSLDAEFHASPVVISDLLMLMSVDGEATFLTLEPHPRELAGGTLGERCVASPAVVDGRLYIRGESHLFCIGGEDES